MVIEAEVHLAVKDRREKKIKGEEEEENKPGGGQKLRYPEGA